MGATTPLLVGDNYGDIGPHSAAIQDHHLYGDDDDDDDDNDDDDDDDDGDTDDDDDCGLQWSRSSSHHFPHLHNIQEQESNKAKCFFFFD